VLGEARRGRAKWVFACFAENLLEISREEEVKTATKRADRGDGIRGEGNDTNPPPPVHCAKYRAKQHQLLTNSNRT
jgi:hypothetical protein